MKIAIASFTLRGAQLAKKLAQALSCDGEATAFAAERYFAALGLPSTQGIARWTREQFAQSDALVFVGATGIAVRAVAPHLRSKLTDPAVVSVDEFGRFAVALVSGHVGGANRLAERIAEITQGQAVVSTATDVNGLFSVDEWVARQGMALINPAAVRDFASALLDGKTVGLASEFPLRGAIPAGMERRETGEVGLYVGIYARMPFAKTVVAVPKTVTLGIGCRKNISEGAVAEAVCEALARINVRPESIRGAASIDLKEGEEGLLAFCRSQAIPIRFFSAEELADTPGEFTSSERVLRVTGVDNVCERAAVRAGGRLIGRKMALSGVTVAIAAENMEICMEETRKND